MWNENVCRLCLSEKNLFCVLEKRENQIDNLEQIILITTGVEILKNDVVSRKICENCRKVTVKMLEFRERSQKTDKYLKGRYAEHLKKLEGKNPQTDKIVESTENSIASTSGQNKDTSKPNKTLKLDLQKLKSMNPTVTNIYTSNPTIKLPLNVLSYNIDPSVWMELDAVENYFGRNKLDMKKAIQAAFKSLKVPKKTLTTNKQRESLPNKVISPISVKSADINIKSQVISKDNKKRNISEEEETTKNDYPSKIKKRKFSSDFSFDNKTSPPTLLDTLQLKPKHVCHVCHSVQNCSETLKTHIKEHFRCNFCKYKFKLTLRKEEHEKTCVVKHMLTSEVYVRLEKIDIDQETIKKCTALGETEETTNPPCTAVDVTEETANSPCTALRKTQETTNFPCTALGVTEETTNSPCTALSVTEETTNLACTALRKTQETTNPACTALRKTQETTNPACTALRKTQETTNPPCTEIIVLSDDDDDDKKTNTSEAKSKAQLKSSTKNTVHYFSTALVRPDIKIKDDNVFNSIDMAASEYGVLKQLLKMNVTSTVKVSIQEETQTESPCNENIVKLSDPDTAKLKGLKPQLFAFKVPVRIQEGAFDVRYVTDKTVSAQKHMNLWSDIKPIGLKPTKSKTSNNTQQLPGTTAQNPVDPRINSGTYVIKTNWERKIHPKPAQKPVQIILNQFISPSMSNSFTGTTETGTSNAQASTSTTSTDVRQQHTFYSTPVMVNNTPQSYFKPIGTNNIPRTSAPINSMGQQQVFVPNNTIQYNNATSVIAGTNHVSTASAVTSIPKNNNGINVYSTNYNVRNQASSLQSLNSSVVPPMNVNSQPRQSSNSTTPQQNFYGQQRQPPNSTVVTSKTISQPRLSPNDGAVPLNVNSHHRQLPNSTVVAPNFNNQQILSSNSTVVTSKTIGQTRLSPNGVAVPLNFNSQPRQLSNSTVVAPNFNNQQILSPNSTVVTSKTIGQPRLSPKDVAVPLNFNSQPRQLSNSTVVAPNFNNQQILSSNSTVVTSKTIGQPRLSPNDVAVPLNFNSHHRQLSNGTVVAPNFNIQSRQTTIPSNSISQQRLSQNNFGMGTTGSVVENKTPNTNCNIGTNSLSNSQYSAAGQNNGTIRPMIRVKNICDLK